MTKPNDLLKSFSQFILKNDILSDKYQDDYSLSVEERLELLEVYLHADIFYKEISLCIEFYVDGIFENEQFIDGYTFVKFTVKDGNIEIAYEVGALKYIPTEKFIIKDKIVTDYWNKKSKVKQYSDYQIDKINALINHKLLEKENFNIKNWYRADVKFFGFNNDVLIIDEEMTNQLSWLLTGLKQNAKSDNKNFINLSEFENAVEKFPYLDVNNFYLEISYQEKRITITLDESSLSISAWQYLGEYNPTPFEFEYSTSKAPNIEGDETVWYDIKNDIENHPDENLTFDFQDCEDVFFGEKYKWNINDEPSNYFSLIDEDDDEYQDADYYNNVSYKGQIKFEKIEANIHGQVRGLRGNYRFDFTFVGVRNFQPVSGAGWLVRNYKKQLEGQIKVHGENPTLIVLS